ncbi:MAG: hypothetical protein ACM3IJ_02525 [Candidatus Levyibacteriota bacterium]
MTEVAPQAPKTREGLASRIVGRFFKKNQQEPRVTLQEFAAKSGERPLEQVMAKLPEQEQESLHKLSEVLTQALTEEGKHGVLAIVGGVHTKPWPRKDIDIAVYLEKNEPLQGSYFDRSMNSYRQLEELAEMVTAKDPSFTITERLEPEQDQEFPGMDILRRDGSIALSRNGTKIELIRSAKEKPTDELLREEKLPWSLLAKV